MGELDRSARLALMATLLPVDLDGITCFDLSWFLASPISLYSAMISPWGLGGQEL